MKKIISTVFYLSLLMLPLSLRAETDVLDTAIEVISISISVDDSLNGYAIVKRCPTCADLQLSIDRTTQVSSRGKNISLHKLNHLKTNYALVVYDPKTNHVKKIVW
ncbi:MAG: hypothetical protein GXP11_07940 [Gammaproteobacteria bacterium]|nr:hypothetical protein [Gammaproteobacteria bacterium]